MTHYQRHCALFALVFLSIAPIAEGAHAQLAIEDSHALREAARKQVPAAQKVVAGKRVEKRLDIVSKRGLERSSLYVQSAGASFIKVHFRQFALPKGVIITVRNPSGTEAYRYSHDAKDALTFDPREGDDGRHSFSAMSITGDTAIIEVSGKSNWINGLEHRVMIDYFIEGDTESPSATEYAPTEPVSSLEAAGKRISKPASTCGVGERYDAICWADSNPGEFDRAWPVVRLLTNGTDLCSGWRVGEDNRLFTNNHCVTTQADVSATEVWFGYQKATCDGNDTETIVKVSANQLLATDWTLDYSLFTVNDFSAIEAYGYLGLAIDEVGLGEQIFIPQHGLGRRKQIAIESDMNLSGLCEIDDNDYMGRKEGSDLGYFCDTVGGSSGSPVISSADLRVVALHHYGGCLNSGVKMSLIWPQVEQHFGGVVPSGDADGFDSAIPPVANITYSCTELACEFDGTGSADADGQIVQYTWNFGDGATAAGAKVSHAFASAGNYGVVLTVEDDTGFTGTVQQSVTVDEKNVLPTAAFSVRCDAMSCQFDAGISSDNDGAIVAYHWEFGDGATVQGAGAATDHLYPLEGTYLVRLTVVDDQGGSANAQSSVSVAPAPVNETPLAQFTFSCSELLCSFDASASSDPDGVITEYAWDFGDGEATENGGPQKDYGYAISGYYTVTLQVIDDLGASSSIFASVYVPSAVAENASPTAAFSFACSALTCIFDAGESADPDGTVSSYVWDFGDGATGKGPVFEHAYSTEGTFSVTLEVFDDDNANDSVSKPVNVTLPDPVTPFIELTVMAEKSRGQKQATLAWMGATGASVDIYRNAEPLQTTPNDGEFVDKAIGNRDKAFTYRVCEAGSRSVCSADIAVSF